jgi:hypothetical protein
MPFKRGLQRAEVLERHVRRLDRREALAVDLAGQELVGLEVERARVAGEVGRVGLDAIEEAGRDLGRHRTPASIR